MKIKYYEIYQKTDNKDYYSVVNNEKILHIFPYKFITAVENEVIAKLLCTRMNTDKKLWFYMEMEFEGEPESFDRMDEIEENGNIKEVKSIKKADVYCELKEDEPESTKDKDSKISFLKSQVEALTHLLYECNFEDLLVDKYGKYIGYRWNGMEKYDGNDEAAKERFNLLNDILTIKRCVFYNGEKN